MQNRKWPIVLMTLPVLAGLSCGRGAPSGSEPPAEAPQTSAPTPTAVATPRPPANTPAAPPADSDLRELVAYANAIQPILVEAGLILQRDGEILKAAEAGDEAVLCDGRLEADNASMKDLLGQARSIQPPGDAQAIHDLVLRSGNAWTEALDNVDRFCDTRNALYKVPAALKFWEAALALQDAGNRFWMLIMAEGVQDWVRR